MKKVFSTVAICIALVASVFAIQSCNTENYEVAYAVTVDGDADGNVAVTFPQGQLGVNGTAALDFKLTNQPEEIDTLSAVRYSYARVSNNRDMVLAAEQVDKMFEATSAGGTYDVKIKGYVKEPITGIVIAVDREFTNR